MPSGGLFVALLSPRVFNDYLEWPIAMVALTALVVWILWSEAVNAPAAGLVHQSVLDSFGICSPKRAPPRGREVAVYRAIR